MARIAVVGYVPTVAFLADAAETGGHEIVHMDAHERRAPELRTIDERVERMLASKPQVLHYTNFFDYLHYTRDRDYLMRVRSVVPSLPILLTTSIMEGRRFAQNHRIAHFEVNFGNLHDYVALLQDLAAPDKKSSVK